MKIKKLVASILATALVGTTMAMASVSMEASAVADTYTATLSGQISNTTYWDGDASTISVSADGTYNISLTYTGEDAEVVSEALGLILTLDFNLFNLSDPVDLAGSGIVISVSSVDVNGTSIGYNCSNSSVGGNVFRVNDDGSTIRYNIFNVWGDSSGQHTEDVSVPFDIHTGDTLNVTFSISGLEDAIHKAKVLAGEIVDEPETTTTASSDDSGDNDNTTTSTTTTTTTTANNGGSTTTTKTTTTTKSDSSSSGDSTTTVAQEETTTETGDTGVAGIVLVCALTGFGVVATRKRS